MIEAVKEIGRIRLEKGEEVKESEILDSLLEDAPTPPKPKKEDMRPITLHTVIFNYDTFGRRIEVDFEKIMENETPRKYLWIGNLPSNTDQIYFTTTNLTYLLSQVIPNLSKKISERIGLFKTLKRVIDSVFYDLGIQGRYRYVLDIEKIKLDDVDIEQFSNLKKRAEILKKEEKIESDRLQKKEISNKLSDISKEVLKVVGSNVEEFITNKTVLKKKEIGLYTLKIDGRLMVENEDYQRLVISKKINSLFEENEGICSSCNQPKVITDRPQFAKARSALGYYITDKVGFSSGLSGDFTKSFALCKDCYKNLISGEVFVRNRLRSNIGGLSLYIIPKFLSPGELRQIQLDKWTDYIKESFNSVKSLNGLKEFEERLERYKDFEEVKNNFIINLLFFKARQAELKILKLIKDVPPTRLKMLTRINNEIKDIGDRVLTESDQWHIGLQTIYYLIPLRKKQREIEYRKILGLYDAIFSGKPIYYRFLIKEFVELAQVYRFEKFNTYNIGRPKDSDRELSNTMLKANLLFLYLRRLNILEGGEWSMNYDSLDLDESMMGFVKEMDYDEPKVAMFLLGCLIGKIGYVQYLPESPSKPILKKITYQGMNKNKLIRLLNDVFEKLTYNRDKSKGIPLLHHNEGVFAECKRLMDKNIGKPLSDQENVFYVLSGYAYSTHQAIIGATKLKKAKK